MAWRIRDDGHGEWGWHDDREDYRAAGEAALAWVCSQVRDDDGPWLPEAGGSDSTSPPEIRDSLHSGIAGLAFALREVALDRSLTDEEGLILAGIRDRLRRSVVTQGEASLYLGAAGMAAAIHLAEPDKAAAVQRRLAAEARVDGWRTTLDEDVDADYAFNDLLLGTAGVVMAGVWTGGDAGWRVASTGAEALLRSATATPGGLDWGCNPSLPFRMPNYTHGTAGCAAALAMVGTGLGRPDLVEAAVAGACHLLSIADLSQGGFRVAHYIPARDNGEEPFTYSWCHGPTGTSYLFAALEHAGVDEVSGYSPRQLRRRSLASVLDSGVPERLRPGFWDNDGRCCGTAGVGDALLDAAQDEPDTALADAYLEAACVMGAALLARAITDSTGARWRFTEHRLDDPLLPPGTGWMQGATGIAAFLLRLARVLDEGLLVAKVVDRPDQWWAVPASLRSIRLP